jgi:hypothetical protein
MRSVGLAAFVIFLLVASFSGQVNRSFAAPNDEGQIAVTGSVPPKPSSIITGLSVSPAGTTLSQNQEITYTVEYSSSNVSSVPLTLQVAWNKGTVEGASEASVESLSYVVGSASQAYGGTIPIVDAANGKITWNISSLPAGLGTQYLTFRLKTTDNYTGSLPVETQVSLNVLSPIGVADRTVSVKYQYVPAPATQQTPTPTPSTSATTKPSPISGEPSATSAEFKEIKLQSVGKTTARVVVEMSDVTTLLFRYGVSPTNLTNTIDVNVPAAGHTIYLNNLEPNVVYYFQIALSGDESLASDVFTFTTADVDAPESARKPTAISISQQRSLLYTGPTTAENGDEIKPIPVTQSTVLDVNLAVPNGQDLKSVEVVVRSSTVLGVSTFTINNDEFQSLSTVMTKISDSVYVGKLRTPVASGIYQIVSRIEDNYGNLSEEEIGQLKVVRPFTIIDNKTGEPIDAAAIDLYIYNQQSKLFEVVSNVSTSILNPTYSDKNGMAQFSLAPARYLAKVSAPGYQSLDVEFEIGSQDSTDFPLVSLEEMTNPIVRSYQYSSYLFGREWNRWMDQFRNLAQTKIMYSKFFVLQVLLTVITLAALYSTKLKPFSVYKKLDHRSYFQITLEAGIFFIVHLIQYAIEFSLMTCIIFGIFFLFEYSGFKGFMFMLGACVNLGLWMWYLWIQKNSR